MTDLPNTPKSAMTVLDIAGVTTLEDCATWPAGELAALHGVGPKAIRLLRPAMAERGISFRRPD